MSFSRGSRIVRNGIYDGETAPTNTNIIWFDTTEKALKYYDGTLGQWEATSPKTDGVGSGIVKWVSQVGYLVDQLVIFDNKIYICDIAHTSSLNFSDDIVNWTLLTSSGSNFNLSDLLDVDNANKADLRMLVWDSASKKHVYTDLPSGGLFVKNIENLTLSTASDGSSVTLNWTNPTSDNFDSREIYVGGTDLSGLSQEECMNTTDVILLESAIGTGNGLEDSYTHTGIVIDSTYHYRVFTKYLNSDGTYSYSTGSSISVLVEPSVYSGIVTNVNGDSDSSSISLTWDNPTETKFAKVHVRYKVGSYPMSETDGNDAGTFTDNTHSTTPLKIIGLTTETAYYISFFPEDKYGNISTDTGNKFTFSTYSTYGFNITTGERLLDASNLLLLDFNNLYPWNSISRCVISDAGTVRYYLDNNDSTLKEDGTVANLDGVDGQIVVEIPAFYYKLDGDSIYITSQSATGYTLFPTTYIGSYESSLNVNKLQSISGALPETGKGLVEYRSLAQARGVGWDIVDFETGNVINYLFFVKYATLNSQDILGQGITNDNQIQITGGTNSLGNKDSVVTDTYASFLGLENVYGNTFECRRGLISKDDAYYINGVATTDIPIVDSGFISSFNSKLIADEVLGSDNTFTGDYHTAHVSGQENYSLHGGHYSDGSKAGLTRLHLGARYAQTDQFMTNVETLTDGDVYEYELDLTQYDDVVKLSSIELEDLSTSIKVNLSLSYPSVSSRIMYR